MADREALSKLLEQDQVRLEPFADHHIPNLRKAYDQDTEIWEIYPVNMSGEHFNAGFAVFNNNLKNGSWVGFAIFNTETDELVGLTNYINPDAQGVVEIGGTYIAPSVRGSSFNRTMKKLMIEHAFACGYRKVGFKVDSRNKRSMAAVLKLGAKQEGVLRANMITWTGYVRDTALFGLLPEEWTG